MMNDKKVLSFLLVVSLTFVSLQFTAEAQILEPQYEHVYAGAGGGMRTIKIDKADSVNSDIVDFDENNFAYKVYGGWRISKHFGVETSYIDAIEAEGSLLTTAGANDLEVDARAATAHVVGYIPTGNIYNPDPKNIDLYGKVGPAWVDLNTSGDVTDNQGNTIRMDKSESKIGVSIGVGSNISISRNWILRVEGQAITALSGNVDQEIYMGFVGLQYAFR